MVACLIFYLFLASSSYSFYCLTLLLFTPPFFLPSFLPPSFLLSFLHFSFLVLTEHWGGRWPFWLSPRQAIIVPIDMKVSYSARSGDWSCYNLILYQIILKSLSSYSFIFLFVSQSLTHFLCACVSLYLVSLSLFFLSFYYLIKCILLVKLFYFNFISDHSNISLIHLFGS